MLTDESTPYQRLAQELDRRCQQMATGDLCFSTHEKEGQFHLFYGRLLYVTGEFHRVRRWQRAVVKYCSGWKPSSALISFEQNKPWEYQMLYEGVAREQISLTQAKVVIRQVSLEILFSLARYSDLSCQWKSYQEENTQLSLGLTLSFPEVKPIFAKADQMQQQWQAAGLSSISPDLSPVSKKKLNPEALSGMAKYLNGKFTLWDIAVRTEKPVTAITKALVPLIKKGILQLRRIPDVSAPISPTPTKTLPPSDASSQSRKQPFLITCIDDSPVIAQSLRKILEPAGYKVVGILDPVKALAQIAEQKPDLIFLDLIMPHANGYTVCQFLRNAPLFEHTPVIILTSRDNVIDRSRAKLVGASDFLVKPPKAQETLEIVQKYLPRSSKVLT
ncbi:MAG: response regulator [Limnoraphis robusta]|jgi:chemotaxis family two-component system response regulator PixG|uniref:Protein PatA n=2 Tax=Limnoraphis TaxID=1332112 RepID=A0ABU5TUZ3_9CYAN|nr:response regulator [Limnoraphis robusta]MEA5496218.1 response regulator [Limnoraphis robusta BA-68 BA1]MEA5518723.1 response regulator [Limnoraphis robusta CCNP1315]MEA5540907.1 response regulator [Limnoraphis robusta Tam1]MEA5544956.1 response regulator [Limnoraphis robusta CCNP1324]